MNNIAIGTVMSVNRTDRTANVVYSNSGMASAPLKIISTRSSEGVQWFPEVNQKVLCILIENGEGDGFIIGGL